MINKLVEFALKQPLFVLLGTILFIGAGTIAFKALPVEAFPDVTDTQVTVITLFPGRAAEEVEKQVTLPLEVALAGLPNSIRMFSHTQFGLSYIIITFNDDANAYFARQQVVERLNGVDLPPGVQAQLAPFSTAIGEIYRYRLKGEGASARELRTYQDWVVSRQLKLVPGVADVTSFGGLIKQYEVHPDLAKMRDYLDRMDRSASSAPAPTGEPWRMLAALGPRMLDLAARLGFRESGRDGDVVTVVRTL